MNFVLSAKEQAVKFKSTTTVPALTFRLTEVLGDGNTKKIPQPEGARKSERKIF